MSSTLGVGMVESTKLVEMIGGEAEVAVALTLTVLVTAGWLKVAKFAVL